MEIKKLAVIGCGSMGGGMALLFAEKGITVLLKDPSEESLNQVLETARKEGLQDRLEKHQGYESLCKNLSAPRIFILSLPHGTVGDSVVDGLHPYLEKGDIIIDASNEHWENTQRRQGKLVTMGVFYIGMGVSGGYQAARRGPSMCPGGEEAALSLVLPLLEQVAVKDAKGKACVGRAGMGGSGHYVKMIHNGIEHGMMSALAEAWQTMNLCLGMGYDEIGDELARWNDSREMKNTFLVEIGSHICKQRDSSGKHVLAYVEDKVVQDIDGSEGTGTWSQSEAVRLHIPAPTLTTAHYIRIASAFRRDRKKINETFHGHFSVAKWTGSAEEKKAFLEDLRKAVYVVFLSSFIQGINIIEQANQENRWMVNYPDVIQIWRDGCIIRTDHIVDMLEKIFARGDVDRDLLRHHAITQELTDNYQSLKRIVAKGVESNSVIPSLSATLEYLKFSNNTILPTQFYEAQLDYFGKHMFDLKSEPAGEPKTGEHHFEWKPA